MSSFLGSPQGCLSVLQLWQWIAVPQNLSFQRWINNYWQIPGRREEFPNLLQSLFCPYTGHICIFEGTHVGIHILQKENGYNSTLQNRPQNTLEPETCSHGTKYNATSTATQPRVKYKDPNANLNIYAILTCVRFIWITTNPGIKSQL